MKRTKIIFWVCTVFIFLFEGIMPLSTLLFAPEYTNVGTKPLGYPDYFANALVVFKFLGFEKKDDRDIGILLIKFL